MSRIIEERWKGIPNRRSNKKKDYFLSCVHYLFPTPHIKSIFEGQKRQKADWWVWRGWETVTICDLGDNSGIFELAIWKRSSCLKHTRPPPSLLQSWPQLPTFSLSPISVTSLNSQLWSSGFWGVFHLVGWLCDGGGVGIMTEWIKELKREVNMLINWSD